MSFRPTPSCDGDAALLKSPIFTWIEIDLSAVEGNVKALRTATGVPIMAVVKANGYGHGAVEISQAALAAGASWLAVSCAEEALVPVSYTHLTLPTN